MNVLVIRHSDLYCGPLLDRVDSAFLVHEAAQELPPGAAARYRRVYRVSSYDSLEELAAVAADLRVGGATIDEVVSFVERTQYAAGYLAALLEITHPSPASSLHARDKRVMKQVATVAGVPCARFRSLPDAGADADPAELGLALGFPMILKPANGFGTFSTRLVHDERELAATLDGFRFHPDLHSRHLIAEEFIAGDELHIDTVWHDGEPWVFCVSRYFNPILDASSNGTLFGSVVLHQEDHPTLYAELLDLHRRLNKAVGLNRGAGHLEVFREHGTGRLLFSELASRLGGANIPESVGARCGVDLKQVFAHEVTGGDPGDLPLRDGRHRNTGILHLSPSRSGTITALPDRAELLTHPNVLSAVVLAAVGDVIDLDERGGWLVLLTLGANSEAELERVAAQLAADFPVAVAEGA